MAAPHSSSQQDPAPGVPKAWGVSPTLLRNGGALLFLQPGPQPVPSPGCMGLAPCLRVFPFSPQMAELNPLKAPQFFLNLATPSVPRGLRSGATGTPDFSLSSSSTPRGSGARSLLAREPCEEGACEVPARPPHLAPQQTPRKSASWASGSGRGRARAGLPAGDGTYSRGKD